MAGGGSSSSRRNTNNRPAANPPPPLPAGAVGYNLYGSLVDAAGRTISFRAHNNDEDDDDEEDQEDEEDEDNEEDEEDEEDSTGGVSLNSQKKNFTSYEDVTGQDLPREVHWAYGDQPLNPTTDLVQKQFRKELISRLQYLKIRRLICRIERDERPDKQAQRELDIVFGAVTDEAKLQHPHLVAYALPTSEIKRRETAHQDSDFTFPTFEDNRVGSSVPLLLDQLVDTHFSLFGGTFKIPLEETCPVPDIFAAATSEWTDLLLRDERRASRQTTKEYLKIRISCVQYTELRDAILRYYNPNSNLDLSGLAKEQAEKVFKASFGKGFRKNSADQRLSIDTIWRFEPPKASQEEYRWPTFQPGLPGLNLPHPLASVLTYTLFVGDILAGTKTLDDTQFDLRSPDCPDDKLRKKLNQKASTKSQWKPRLPTPTTGGPAEDKYILYAHVDKDWAEATTAKMTNRKKSGAAAAAAGSAGQPATMTSSQRRQIQTNVSNIKAPKTPSKKASAASPASSSSRLTRAAAKTHAGDDDDDDDDDGEGGGGQVEDDSPIPGSSGKKKEEATAAAEKEEDGVPQNVDIWGRVAPEVDDPKLPWLAQSVPRTPSAYSSMPACKDADVPKKRKFGTLPSSTSPLNYGDDLPEEDDDKINERLAKSSGFQAKDIARWRAEGLAVCENGVILMERAFDQNRRVVQRRMIGEINRTGRTVEGFAYDQWFDEYIGRTAVGRRSNTAPKTFTNPVQDRNAAQRKNAFFVRGLSWPPVDYIENTAEFWQLAADSVPDLDQHVEDLDHDDLAVVTKAFTMDTTDFISATDMPDPEPAKWAGEQVSFKAWKIRYKKKSKESWSDGVKRFGPAVIPIHARLSESSFLPADDDDDDEDDGGAVVVKQEELEDDEEEGGGGGVEMMQVDAREAGIDDDDDDDDDDDENSGLIRPSAQDNPPTKRGSMAPPKTIPSRRSIADSSSSNGRPGPANKKPRLSSLEQMRAASSAMSNKKEAPAGQPAPSKTAVGGGGAAAAGAATPLNLDVFEQLDGVPSEATPAMLEARDMLQKMGFPVKNLDMDGAIEQPPLAEDQLGLRPPPSLKKDDGQVFHGCTPAEAQIAANIKWAADAAVAVGNIATLEGLKAFFLQRLVDMRERVWALLRANTPQTFAPVAEVIPGGFDVFRTWCVKVAHGSNIDHAEISDKAQNLYAATAKHSALLLEKFELKRQIARLNEQLDKVVAEIPKAAEWVRDASTQQLVAGKFIAPDEETYYQPRYVFDSAETYVPGYLGNKLHKASFHKSEFQEVVVGLTDMAHRFTPVIDHLFEGKKTLTGEQMWQAIENLMQPKEWVKFNELRGHPASATAVPLMAWEVARPAKISPADLIKRAQDKTPMIQLRTDQGLVPRGLQVSYDVCRQQGYDALVQRMVTQLIDAGVDMSTLVVDPPEWRKDQTREMQAICHHLRAEGVDMSTWPKPPSGRLQKTIAAACVAMGIPIAKPRPATLQQPQPAAAAAGPATPVKAAGDTTTNTATPLSEKEHKKRLAKAIRLREAIADVPALMVWAKKDITAGGYLDELDDLDGAEFQSSHDRLHVWFEQHKDNVPQAYIDRENQEKQAKD